MAYESDTERVRQWRIRNPEKWKANSLKSEGKRKGYKITIEKYNQLYSDQHGKCAICKRPSTDFATSLSVDHNHVTGEVRGLLCSKCNRGIGFLNDSVEMLYSAIEYINKCEKSYK